MMINSENELKNTVLYNKYTYEIFLCLCSATIFLVIHSFTGHWIWKAQPYNSYILQVQSWLQGRLDLGQDYPYLELAIFDGKYFVSFPPFPSYIMIPFVALGWNSCDGIIAFVFSLAGVVYAYKIMRHFNIEERISAMFALLLTFGSNWLMTSQNAWVWFIAQNMSFTLSLMAIYYALKNNSGLSLACWACAVGCRPFQAMYLPVILYILYTVHKTENPNDRILDIIKKRWKSVIPMLIIAVSYMLLNYLRFGSIIEFGHNYLPEHTRSELGQFHYSYIPGNLHNLIRLPQIKDGHAEFTSFNGMNIFLVSPVFISFIVYIVHALITKTMSQKTLIAMIFVLVIIHLISLCAHVRLGGAHFGNRYPSDSLPFVYLAIAELYKKEKPVLFNYPLFFVGFSLNIIGTILFYTGNL